MSEFTSGLLFLQENRDAVKTSAENHLNPVFEYIVHKVNNRWSALLAEDYSNHRISTLIKEISQDFPVLYFDHAGDHGWSYRLIEAYTVTSSIAVGYELDWHLAYEYLELKYPDLAGDPKSLFDMVDDVPVLYAQLRKSTQYRQAVEEMYENHHPSKFSVFDVSDEQIQRLTKEITAAVYKESHEMMLKQVDSFREILDFEEISWMSYRYVKKSQEQDEEE